MMQDSNMRFRLNFLLGIMLVVSLTACSVPRLAYLNAESLAYRWVDNYVWFTAEQEERARADIARFFTWHREAELPKYALLLERVRSRVQDPVSANVIREDLADLRAHVGRMLEFAVPASARLARSLSEEQLLRIRRKLESDTAAKRDEVMNRTPQQRRQARYERMLERAEYWFGRFNRVQRQRLRTLVEAEPLDDDLWLDERVQRERELLGLLGRIRFEQPEQAQAEAMFHAYLARALAFFTRKQHGERIEASERAAARLTAEIIRMASAGQRAHALRRVDDLTADVLALSGRN